MEALLYVRDFSNYLSQLGYSKGSVQMLPSCVAEFLDYVSKPLNQVISLDILSYHEYLQSRPNKRRSGGLSSMMIHHHMYAVRLFMSWQEHIGELEENPMSSIRFLSPEKKPRAILSISEVKALYKESISLKERAILGLFYGCGLRRSEAESLNIGDVHLRSQLLYVREGKGAKRRVVPISSQSKEDLKAYLYKERKGLKGETSFVTNSNGGRMRGLSYLGIVKEIAQRAALEKEVTLHGLRHSIATHLLQGGMGVEYVRDFLGHSCLESTQVYTQVSESQIYRLSQ